MPSLPAAGALPSRLTPAQFARWNELVTTTAADAADATDATAADAADAATDGDVAVEAPFTGEIICHAPASTPADVEHALDRARDAQPRWADRSTDQRAAVLNRFHDLVLERREELADLMQLESGKARSDAFEEVMDVALTARYYATRVADFVGDDDRRGALPLISTATVTYDPVGVVGVISPWNYPLTLAVGDAIPALLAGNTIVLKPAEETPYTALATVELLREAGLPHDAFHVVVGDGPTLGDPLIAGVDYVSFTGSTEVGREIAATAGRALVDCSLELGGKNPVYVRADVDVDDAVRQTLGACYSNAGQLCIAAERLYVHESIADDFARRFVDAVADLTLEASYEYGVDVGSLISQRQLDRVQSHVADARDRGATVAVGGNRRPDVGPYAYAPTVLEDLPRDATAACEETFGPVVAMEPVPSDAAAVERMNDTEYGLHAAIMSEDVQTATAIANDLAVGSVSINDGYVSSWAATDAPMGGVKDSGIGRRHGRHGMVKYTEPKTTATTRGRPFDPITGPSERRATLLAKALRLWRHVPFLR